MYELCYNNLQISSLPLFVNNMINSHCTRSSSDIYTHSVSSLEKRNFTVTWNNCLNDIRYLSKCLLLHERKKIF